MFKKQKSILCRVGLHKFEQWPENWEVIPTPLAYCKRCGKTLSEEDMYK